MEPPKRKLKFHKTRVSSLASIVVRASARDFNDAQLIILLRTLRTRSHWLKDVIIVDKYANLPGFIFSSLSLVLSLSLKTLNFHRHFLSVTIARYDANKFPHCLWIGRDKKWCVINDDSYVIVTHFEAW